MTKHSLQTNIRLCICTTVYLFWSCLCLAQEQLPEAGLKFELPHNWRFISRNGPQQPVHEAVVYVYERDVLPGQPNNCTAAFLIQTTSDSLTLAQLLMQYPPNEQLVVRDSLPAVHVNSPLFFLQSLLLRGHKPGEPQQAVWLAYIRYNQRLLVIRLTAPEALMGDVFREFTTMLRTLR